MDLKLLFGRKFLKKSFGEVSSNLDNVDCTQFRQALKDNSAPLIPNRLFNAKVVDELFHKIDGTEIKRDSVGNFSSAVPHEKNDRLEQQELVDWVKMNYETFTGKKISDNELMSMSMAKFMGIVDEMLDNGYEL